MSEIEKNKKTENAENSEQDNVAALYNKIREFEVELETGGTRWAYIRTPTPDEYRRAEEYMLSVTASKAKGEPDPITGEVIILPTRDNMMEYAREKGIWSETDDVKFATLEMQLKNKIAELAKGKMSLAQGYALATQIMQHRREIHPYNQRKWEIYGLTAEAAGEEAMNRYLCIATAEWKNGERIFPNIAAFEKGGKLRNEVLGRYMLMVKIANDYTAPLETEMAFFQKYGFLTKDGTLYDFAKKEKVEDIVGDEEQEEILTGFTDENGNVVEKSFHPSYQTENEAKPDDTLKAGG